jgi:hypothetical protein
MFPGLAVRLEAGAKEHRQGAAIVGVLRITGTRRVRLDGAHAFRPQPFNGRIEQPRSDAVPSIG